MEKTWTVVQFLEENAVEAVPTSWILNNKCYWPSLGREKLIQCIKKNEEPNTCWPLYEIKVFRNSSFSNYLVAREKARKAEATSDINSSDCEKRRVSKKVLWSSDSDESDHFETRLPDPPQFRKSEIMKKCIPAAAGSIQAQLQDNSIKINEKSNEVPNRNRDTNFRCICCKEHPSNDNMLRDIIRKQNLILAFLKQMNDDLQDMKLKLERGNSNELNVTSFLTLFNFPLKSYDDLEKFEEYLQNTDDFQTVVQELSKLGGTNLYDFTRRALTLILTNSLSEQFTWYGMKGKKIFKNLKLAEALMLASEIYDKEVTKKDIEECIRKWLRRAKERKD